MSAAETALPAPKHFAIRLLGHLPFIHHNRSRFLYNLDVELLKHWANLQRALDGKSAFYVPNGMQRDQIEQEQERLESARLGVVALTRIWGLEPKVGREVPKRVRSLLVRRAHRDSERALNQHKVSAGVFEGYSPEEVIGLEELLHYLDSKVCLMKDVGEPCLEYHSLSESIGYILQARIAGR